MVEMWSFDARAAIGIIRGINGVQSVSLYGSKLHVAVSGSEVVDEIIKATGRSGIVIRGHREILPSIEDIFISKVEVR